MTAIQWTDETWNPVTGCTKVSRGCAHCYAERLFPRPYPGRPFSDVQFHRERLNQPRRWRRPRRVFVNSMSDLFHEAVRDDEIEQIFYVMSDTPQHTFQVLTKRPERMRDFMLSRTARDCTYGEVWPLPNVWLGVSAEDQRTTDERVPLLLDTPAAVRFLSVEPLLGPVDLAGPLDPPCAERGLDWVIVGGESGPRARGCSLFQMQRIVDACRAASVPVFVKQLGRRPVPDFSRRPPMFCSVDNITDRKGGDPAEWPPSLRVREFPR